MRLVRFGVASINTTVGKTDGNTTKAISMALAMAQDGVTVAAFPEQVIGGYPAEDLVQWPAFVEAQGHELARFAEETSGRSAVFVVGLVVAKGGQVYNCAALVHKGKVLGLCPKEKLPLYNVFYEARTLSRGIPGEQSEVNLPGFHYSIPFGDYLYAFDFGTLALEVCEDIWSPDGPMRRRCYSGAEVVVNLSASPFRVGVVGTRREMIATRSADNQATVVYANALGANDGLVFDGGGYVFQNGRLCLDAERFTEGFGAVTVDLDRTKRMRSENTTWRSDCELFHTSHKAVPVVNLTDRHVKRMGLKYAAPAHRNFFLPTETPVRTAREDFCEDILDVMAFGVGDYYEKTGAFKCIGVALSGGRDSLLCLLVAHRYFAKKYASLPGVERREAISQRLRAFYMPTHYSSNATCSAAQKAAEELGVPFTILSIEDAFKREEEAAQAMLQPGEKMTPLTLQNIQARLRAQRMWNWSNAAGGLFLQTGNMSEKAVGYTTVGGDLMGAIAPIANVPKTAVIYLLDYLLETMGLRGIQQTLSIPASAELAPNQEDEKDLMPFPVLDASFTLFAGEKMSPDEMKEVLGSMFPEYGGETISGWVDKFIRLFHQNIFKWVQSPLSIHVGTLDLDRERALQFPVVSKPEWANLAPRRPNLAVA